ncbi:MAG: TonB-dependent receptor [Terracidiphilus sp.]|nr:TonB-dependent receptor [Terracidiphilus sp.]
MVAILCLCVGQAAYAQQDLGHIFGTVTDQTGAAVPNAKVTITWQATGLSQTVTSNETGYYVSQPLKVGQYTVSAEAAGFTISVIRNLEVDAAARVQANLALKIGSASSNIVVQDTPPVINTTDAIIGNTIDTRSAQQLPVNGRSVLALATLSPGVESAVGAVSEGFQNRGTAVSAIKIGGGVSGLNNNILDGVSNMQDWLGEVAINLKSDAVQEYRILSGIVPAQFGYTSGGVVDVVSRSGTNGLHGSVYEFLRNDALDAETSFPRPTYGKAELRFNNYGGTLGGPVLKDKLFVFGNYEQYNYISKYPSYFTVPTLQERSGDFSDLGQSISGVCTPVKIYDADNVVGGQRQQFASNSIAGRIDPVALAYQNLFYPKPNNTSGGYDSCSHANNYMGQEPVLSHERQGIIRGDYKLSDKDNFVGRYAYYLNHANNGSNSIGGLNNAYTGRNDDLKTQSAVFSEAHVFRPNLLNDARFGLMIGGFPFMAATANKNIAGTIGLPNSTAIAAPLMNNGVATANITVGFRSSATVELLDDLTWIVKDHTIHMGGSARWTEGYNNQTGSSPAGTFNFSSSTTAQGNDTTTVSGTGSTYASYLLGQTTSGSTLVQRGSAFRRMLYAGYIQDDWRVSPRLTLNLGLRYDLMTQAVEKQNGLENFDITQKNPSNSLFMGLMQYAATNGNGRNFVGENYGDWGPRLGFAYSLADNKTIIRGGAAIYYPSTAVQSYDQSSGNTAGYTSMANTYSTTTSKGYLFQLKNGIPGTWTQPLGASGGYNIFLGQSANYITPEAKDPSSQVIGLTVSRELPFSMVLDVSYGGNHGNHFENFSPNLNALNPQYYSLGTAALSATVTNPYYGLFTGSTLGTSATITKKQSLLPFPYMQGVGMQNPRNGSYWSNLGMLSVQRRARSGLQVMGAYTFGKVTDAGVQGVSDLSAYGSGTSASPQNPFNPKADHSVDAIDVTHRASASVLYDLPFGKNKPYFNSARFDRIASGWQLGTIITMESGRPLSITGASNQLASRPNFDPNVSYKVSHASRSSLYKNGKLMWFNPNAFVNPPDYTYGNVPRRMADLRAPGFGNVDISAFKTTHIAGRASFEFRIEAYNAFNHPNLPAPSTSFSAGAPVDANNPYNEGGRNTSSTFGYITSGATSTRNIQLGGKLFF